MSFTDQPWTFLIHGSGHGATCHLSCTNMAGIWNASLHLENNDWVNVSNGVAQLITNNLQATSLLTHYCRGWFLQRNTKNFASLLIVCPPYFP